MLSIPVIGGDLEEVTKHLFVQNLQPLQITPAKIIF